MRSTGQSASGTCRGDHTISGCAFHQIVSVILRIRKERRYGNVRVSLHLQRHYHAYVSPRTILKIFHRYHVGRISM